MGQEVAAMGSRWVFATVAGILLALALAAAPAAPGEEPEAAPPASSKDEEKARKEEKKRAKEEKAREKRLEKAREERERQAAKEEKKQAKQAEKAAKKKAKKKAKTYATTAEQKKFASRNPMDLLVEAQSYLKKEKWFKAQEILLVLEDNERARELQADVKLSLADSYYGQGGSLNWVEATSRYRSFLTFYPGDPRTDYAQYRIGMCYFFQIPKAERDQSPTRNAIFEFERLVELFPRSEWADEAQGHIRDCRERLAEHDLAVGEYYFVREEWGGAAARFRALLKEYPDYSGKAHVYWRLAEASYKLGAREEGDLYRQLYQGLGGKRGVDVLKAPAKKEEERPAEAEKRHETGEPGQGKRAAKKAEPQESESEKKKEPAAQAAAAPEKAEKAAVRSEKEEARLERWRAQEAKEKAERAKKEKAKAEKKARKEAEEAAKKAAREEQEEASSEEKQ